MVKENPSQNLTALVKGILARAKEKEGYVNKTKLFKYLYLIDIESYRRTGGTLTDFNWIFYHYGPWARECEDLYSNLKEAGEIIIKTGSRPDLGTEFVEASEPVNLEDVIEDWRLEHAIRNLVDRWADRSLGEMLEYVYFHTEPMEEAERGKPLDFSKVERAFHPQPVVLKRQAPDKAEVQRMRKAVAERKACQPEPKSERFTPAPYDDNYFEALRIMEEEDVLWR